MRQQTWFAAIVCTIAVLPGFIVGGLFKAFLYIFGGWADGSDFLYLRALFGIETPGMVYEWVFAHAIPNFMQAAIAGFVAVWLMEKIAKGANYSLAATITGALYTGFLICLIAIVLLRLGVTSEMLLSTVQCVGLWAGLGSAAAALPAPKTAAAVKGKTNQQFLKDHLLDFEVVAVLIIAAMAHFYFAFGWIVSVLLGLTAFILIPLLVLCWYQARAIFFIRRFRKIHRPSPTSASPPKTSTKPVP